MSVSVRCQHCHSWHSYDGDDLHIALIPGGIHDSVQLLWFTCQMCGDFNSESIPEGAAGQLSGLGAQTFVVGPIPELDEPVRQRYDRIPESVARMVESMSVGAFSAAVHRMFGT